MLISDALTILHRLYERDTDEPTSGSDDYLVRIALINQAINLWDSQEGILWKELFDTHEFSTVAATASYNCPSDWDFPSGFLRIYVNGTSLSPTLFSYVSPERFESIEKAEDSNEYVYTIKGSKGAQTINVYPTPTTANNFASKTARLDHKKTVTTFATGAETTEIEMSDPYFAIYWPLAQLYGDDNNPDMADQMLSIANQKLSAMRIKNEAMPPFQQNRLDDVYLDGFGV